MYIRISRARCDASKCQAVLDAAEEVNPVLRRQPGCQSSYWAVDRTRGALLAVSTWDTREHADFSREALASGAGAAGARRMQEAGGQLDPPEIYEIVDWRS